MSKTLLILLTLALYSLRLFSQDSLNYESKWQIKPNYGINIPITKLSDGRITDDLFEYSDHSRYWQVLSIAYFFRKHWGLEFNFQGMTSKNIANRTENFITAINAEYDENHYITASTGASYSSSGPPLAGNFHRGFIGVIYRYEKNRLFIYPKVSIGINAFNTDWGQAILKQKNSNNLLKVSYMAEKIPNDYFIIATSTAFGYKLTKRFYINLDIMTSYYKTNIMYTKKTTDLNTNLSTQENINYNKNIFTLSLAGGLIFVVN